MANEQWLIDANSLKEKLQKHHDFFVNAWGGFSNLPAKDKARVDEITNCIAEVVNAPTVDAVEVSRLGYLGRLMMPYRGCPRGRMGARGDGRITELDPITDVEGDIWVPVLEEDLNALKAKAVEVVHGQWFDYDNDPMWQECSACGYRIQYSYSKDCKYCPNCGAKMESGNKDGNV